MAANESTEKEAIEKELAQARKSESYLNKQRRAFIDGLYKQSVKRTLSPSKLREMRRGAQETDKALKYLAPHIAGLEKNLGDAIASEKWEQYCAAMEGKGYLRKGGVWMAAESLKLEMAHKGKVFQPSWGDRPEENWIDDAAAAQDFISKEGTKHDTGNA